MQTKSNDNKLVAAPKLKIKRPNFVKSVGKLLREKPKPAVTYKITVTVENVTKEHTYTKWKKAKREYNELVAIIIGSKNKVGSNKPANMTLYVDGQPMAKFTN